MGEVNEMLETLVARLTPAMLSCALPSLHVNILQNSAGDFSDLLGSNSNVDDHSADAILCPVC